MSKAKTVRVLQTGDWHIGRFPGPETNGENARYLDICRCLNALVETAKQRRPDLTVVSGDIFHSARTWSDRGLQEVNTAIHYIRRLAEIAPVVVLRGTPNHDGEKHFEMLSTAFGGDENALFGKSVFIITEPKVVRFFCGRCGWVQVAGLPGFDRGVFRAQHPGLDREEETQVFTEALERIVMGLKAQCEPGVPAILSTHFTVPGCNMESGQTALFAQFEPVIYPATLAAAGFDLVALGHIHRPQQLPEAGNAFYCGSLTGLTFNDEGQERGFYIHEIAPGQPPVSEFIETPYRRFETIRLTQTDIDGINAGALDEVACDYWKWREPGIEGAIVRVLYSCTDAANKAFNRALLEKRLYDDGAFWVQEITPEEITASVNRDELTGDNTPEENLAAYLDEKGKTPEDAARIVELARPIIAETLEKNRVEASTGVFLPLEIEVKNYRNYRDEVFSYEGITFATINGENGAGKSSLFMDAMLDALYEEPREGDLTGWICNAPDARSGSIKFTFRLGEKTYRVTRTRAKSGKATLNIAELVEGEWQDRSAERFKDTQAIIEHTIGMDSLTLKATGLIMQDQYGLFLTADKTDRMAILGSILGLGIYGDMESAAAEKATVANREVRRIADTEREITLALPVREVLEQNIQSAAEARAQVREEISKAKEEADNIRFRLRVASDAALRALKILEEINTLRDKQTACRAAQTAHSTAIALADSILGQREAIEAGVAEYHRLAEQEKTMLGDVTLYDVRTAEHSRIVKELEEARAKKARLTAEKTAAGNSQWSYEQALAGAPELEEKAARLEKVEAALAELEKQNARYKENDREHTRAVTELERAKLRHKGEKARMTDLIESLERRAAMLENSGCTAETPSCSFLRDAIEARENLPAARDALAQYTAHSDAEIAELKGRVDELALLLPTPEFYDALEEQQILAAELRQAAKMLAEMAVQKERLSALKARMEAIDKEVAELDATINALEIQRTDALAELHRIEAIMEEYTALGARMAQAKVWLEREKQLPAAIEKKTAAETRLAELKTEEADLASQILLKGAEHEKEAFEAANTVQLKESLSRADAAVSTKEETLKTLDEMSGRYQRQMEELEKAEARLAELREEAAAQGALAADYEELKRAFSQDGIPHNIVRTIVPLFEATATNILGQMSGGHMSVEMRMEKTLKSNAKKEVTALDIIVNDAATGALPYMSRSGGERVKAALSVILALAEIKSSTAGVQLGFLAVDEPPFLDHYGTQAYVDALEAIQRRYPNTKIFAISHDPEFKARFPQSITIYKDENGSHVLLD